MSRWIAGFLVGVLTALSMRAALADSTCKIYYAGGGANLASGSSPSAACSGFASKFQASLAAVGYSGASASGSVSGDGGTCNVTYTYTNSDGSTGQSGSVSDIWSSTTTDCPTGCTAGSSTTASGTGGSVPSSFCQGGCQYTASGVSALLVSRGLWSTGGTATGQACSTVDSAVSSGSCVSAAGLRVCSTVSGNNTAGCGEVNGKAVCVTSGGASSSGGSACTLYKDGSAACASTAGTPPAPNNGTAGQAATPDAQVMSGSNTTNYYTNTTVNNSTTGVSGDLSGSSSSSSSSGGSSSASSSSGGGSATGGTDCASPPVCTGESISCNIDYQAWHARCDSSTDADLASAIGSVDAVPTSSVDVSAMLSESGPAPNSAGSCPAPTQVTLWNGRTLTLDLWQPLCTFASYIQGVVLALAYFFAGLIQIRGILSRD